MVRALHPVAAAAAAAAVQLLAVLVVLAGVVNVESGPYNWTTLAAL